jgi:two-component system response regulator RegX3
MLGRDRAEDDMTDKPRLLIVEDEPAIRTGLVDVFTYHGFAVTAAADGEAGWQATRSGRYDLLLLDVMLPGLDGFEICRRLRASDRETALILLTARGTDDDVIHGLQLGADDYVTKPFSIAELVLRVSAVLRRTRGAPPARGSFRLRGGIEIDPSNLQGRRGELVFPFTRREMELLQYLHAHGERAVGREELLQRVWGYANALDIETRTVDIHIAKLRRKLEVDPADPQVLLTVRGAGYRLLVA